MLVLSTTRPPEQAVKQTRASDKRSGRGADGGRHHLGEVALVVRADKADRETGVPGVRPHHRDEQLAQHIVTVCLHPKITPSQASAPARPRRLL